MQIRTFPTAASPSSTSLTLLLGFWGAAVESAIVCRYESQDGYRFDGKSGQDSSKAIHARARRGM